MEIMREAGLEPLGPYPGSKVPWRCRCMKCEREITPRYNTVQQGGGCAYCAGNSTDAAAAEAAMRAAGLEPLEPYRGNQVAWRCRCVKCGQEVTPNLHNVKAGNGGCIHCTSSGFWSMDHDSPATVYLVIHEPLRAVKVGVMRQNSRRLKHHLRNGWRLLNAWRDLEPSRAFAAEQAVLVAWRNAGIPDAVPREEMPHGGHSETAPIDLVDLAKTRAIIERYVRVVN